MDIFPAIDLKDGQCVRLVQGDFNAATIYENDPVRVANNFAKAGAEWLHVVDLDGARDGQSRQLDLIAALAQNAPLKIQAGGGVRAPELIKQLLAVGVARVVVGSTAVKDPKMVRGWLKRFGPDRIVIALDVKLDDKGEPELLTHGWLQGSNKSLWDLLEAYEESGLKTVLCTDISRDGMLKGTNHALYEQLKKRHPELDILASGGVDGIGDLEVLAGLGCKGAIVGKAIYEGRIDLADALRRTKAA